MPSNHLILCHRLLLPSLIFPSIRVFSNESVLSIRWPKYWNFSFSVSPSNEHRGLISFRMDWLDLLAVQLFKNDHNSHCQQAEGCIFCIFSGTWCHLGFPDSSVGKESTCNAGDPGWIPGSGRFAGERIGYPPQYSWASLVAQLVKNLPAMQETWVRSLGWDKSPGEGKGYPLQYSGLENSMDCIDHEVTKSRIQLSHFHFHGHDIGPRYHCFSHT